MAYLSKEEPPLWIGGFESRSHIGEGGEEGSCLPRVFRKRSHFEDTPKQQHEQTQKQAQNQSLSVDDHALATGTNEHEQQDGGESQENNQVDHWVPFT